MVSEVSYYHLKKKNSLFNIICLIKTRNLNGQWKREDPEEIWKEESNSRERNKELCGRRSKGCETCAWFPAAPSVCCPVPYVYIYMPDEKGNSGTQTEVVWVEK